MPFEPARFATALQLPIANENQRSELQEYQALLADFEVDLSALTRKASDRHKFHYLSQAYEFKDWKQVGLIYEQCKRRGKR
jgi:hypothetical protein